MSVIEAKNITNVRYRFCRIDYWLLYVDGITFICYDNDSHKNTKTIHSTD